MKSLLVLVLFLMTGSTAFCGGGTFWKHFERPDAGAGVLFYSLANDDSVASNNVESRLNLVHLSAIGGFNLPFIELSDDMSIGINPNIEVSTALNAGGYYSSLALTIESPSYVTFKYGTDTTWAGTRSIFGATVGLGYRYTIFGLESGFYTFGMPSVMAEINLGKRRSAIGLVKLRYSASLGSHTESLAFDDGTESKIVFTHHAFHLIFTPNY